jgi:hypothetical protein
MKKIALLATIIMIGFSMMCVQGAGADFSGNWVLTKLIPSLIGVPIPNASLVIKQGGNDLEVIRKLADEEKSIKSHYTLDEAENINTEPNAAGTVTIRSTSKWNNGTLVIEGSSTFEGPAKNVTGKWKTEYLLSDNGAVLTVSKTIQTPFGEIVTSEVFNRK